MSYKIYFLFLLFIPTASFCQSNISIEESNAFINNFYFNGSLSLNTKLGAFAELQTRCHLLDDKIVLDAAYGYGLGLGNTQDKVNSRGNMPSPQNLPSGFLHPNGEVKRTYTSEAGITYNFSRNKSNNKSFVFISGNSRSDFFTRIRAEHLVTKGFRLGIGSYRSNTFVDNMPDLSNYEPGLSVEKTINTHYPNYSFSQILASTTTQYLAFGINRSSIANFKYKTSQTGNTFTHRSHNSLYADVLVGISSNLRKVRVNQDSKEFEIIGLKVNSILSSYGYRIGYINRPARYANYSINLELGFLPGYRIGWASANHASVGKMDGSFYFLARIGLGLTSKKLGRSTDLSTFKIKNK